MVEEIILIYCLCDDILKEMSHLDDPQLRQTDAEICTTALKQCGNMAAMKEKARRFRNRTRRDEEHAWKKPL